MNKLLMCQLSVIVILGSNYVSAETIPVGQFSQGLLNGWKDKSFKGLTQYQLQRDGNTQILAATVSGGASGKFKKIKIELNCTS